MQEGRLVLLKVSELVRGTADSELRTSPLNLTKEIMLFLFFPQWHALSLTNKQ